MREKVGSLPIWQDHLPLRNRVPVCFAQTETKRRINKTTTTNNKQQTTEEDVNGEREEHYITLHPLFHLIPLFLHFYVSR